MPAAGFTSLAGSVDLPPRGGSSGGSATGRRGLV